MTATTKQPCKPKRTAESALAEVYGSALCPGCGCIPSRDWVRGYYGWICGSYNGDHPENPARFVQSNDCSAMHWKHRALKGEAWLGGVYQEVDGLFYYDPTPNRGCYAAHTLREIADYLDAKNKPWQEKIDREMSPPNDPSSGTAAKAGAERKGDNEKS